MKKRWICLLTALTLTVGMCIAEPLAGIAAPLEANGDGSLVRSCSLTIHPEGVNQDGQEVFGEDLKSANVVVDLYQIATVVKTKGYDTYSYQLLEEYEDLKLPTDVKDGEEEDSNKQFARNWDDYAQQVARIILGGDSVAADKVEVEGIDEFSVGDTIPVEAGLYLVVARGKKLTDLKDYKMELTQEDADTGKTRIATIANSNQYTYAFLPSLVSLPSKEAENGVINTANHGDWIFDMTVNLKPERFPRYGSLKIIKTLSEYETMGGVQEKESATFVFEVNGWLDDELVYSNVESITFTAVGGQKSVILNRIPVGAEVTVTEVYSGSSYQVTVPEDGTVNTTIKADEVVSVSFENKYDERRTNGHGIKNQFTFTDGDWIWKSDSGQNANED